jgi:flagellar biosynthesis protein FlhB
MLSVSDHAGDAVTVRNLGRRAEQRLIPMVKDKPLARSMDDSVEVDRAVRPESHKAVAENNSYFVC